ncbi:hypothetical protein ACLBOM_37705 [Escherichia coli]
MFYTHRRWKWLIRTDKLNIFREAVKTFIRVQAAKRLASLVELPNMDTAQAWRCGR